MRRRDFLLFAGIDWIWPINWFPRHVRMGSATFHEIRRGTDKRRYIWIHGDERTAGEVLRRHLKSNAGRGFLVENAQRNIRILNGDLDPNRMFSRVGAERNLRTLNPTWELGQVERALQLLERDRSKFLSRILPKGSDSLLVALHNNGPTYSVQDEARISDAVSLRDLEHPDEFMLCTSRSDYQKLSSGRFNVVLQKEAPPDDDGSLSRLCANRNVRYVNIEAAHGNAAGQRAMLDWVEQVI